MKSTNIAAKTKLDELSDVLLVASQAYWDEYHKSVGSDAVVWVQHTETGQFALYTRGEYAKDLIQFVANLNR